MPSVVILILANVVENLSCHEMLRNTLGEEQLGVKLLGDYTCSTEKQERAWNNFSHE